MWSGLDKTQGVTAVSAILPAFAALAIASLAAIAGCDDQTVAASDLGAELFSSPSVSTSRFNAYACATCHTVDVDAPTVIPGRLDAGYNLAGAPSRGRWWGGGSATLFDAINVCVTQFMGGRELAPEDPEARLIYEYLAANDVGPGTTPSAFTVQRDIPLTTLFTGDAQVGGEIYAAACRRCHGEAHTGTGANSATAVLLPDWPLVMSADRARDATVEKIRHGRFFSLGGVMPPYSTEAMSDDQIGHLLAFLGL